MAAQAATVTVVPVVLTKAEAAARARVSVRTLERAMAAGELRYSGGRTTYRVLIRPEWLDEWIDRRGIDRGGNQD
jgi:hypothetical protein